MQMIHGLWHYGYFHESKWQYQAYEYEMFGRYYDTNNFCDKVYNVNIARFAV